ncbi:MAG: cobalamin-dependent protein [Alphaproteobacteria bacterium]|nr:cobalamin-dependent protein [Alphaproteobacteria bacterium]
MDHRIRYTSTLREALRGFVDADHYRAHFPASRIYPAFEGKQIEEMAMESIELNPSRFLRHTEKMLRHCIDVEQFMVKAITGAAVVLGGWWASDRINYRSVELGSDRLLELVYDIADERLRMGHSPSKPHKIVLSGPDHSRHTLGLAVTGEIFHWHGWNVLAGPTVPYKLLHERVADEWVDILGMTVADDRDMDHIHLTIERCRLDSKNRQLKVMVGGPQVFLRPHLASELGADGASTHAGQAQAMILAWVRQS